MFPIAAHAPRVLRARLISALGVIAISVAKTPLRQFSGHRGQRAPALLLVAVLTIGNMAQTKEPPISAAKIDVIKESFTAKLLGSAGAAA